MTKPLKLRDKERGDVWLTIRDGVVVGAMGSDPKRFLGLTLDAAKHLARYGGEPQRSSVPLARMIGREVMLTPGLMPHAVRDQYGLSLVQAHAILDVRGQYFGPGGKGISAFEKHVLRVLKRGGDTSHQKKTSYEVVLHDPASPWDESKFTVRSKHRSLSAAEKKMLGLSLSEGERAAIRERRR